MMRPAILLLLATGCVPSAEQIRTDCEEKYGYQTERYDDCVADGKEDADNKREAIQHAADGVRESTKRMSNQTKQQEDCTTLCNLGTCYTHCQ